MTNSIERQVERPEIQVPESDTRNLTLLDSSDIVFAVLYSALFIWGLILTLVSI